jgi:hypothetical protein
MQACAVQDGGQLSACRVTWFQAVDVEVAGDDRVVRAVDGAQDGSQSLAKRSVWHAGLSTVQRVVCWTLALHISWQSLLLEAPRIVCMWESRNTAKPWCSCGAVVAGLSDHPEGICVSTLAMCISVMCRRGLPLAACPCSNGSHAHATNGC